MHTCLALSVNSKYQSYLYCQYHVSLQLAHDAQVILILWFIAKLLLYGCLRKITPTSYSVDLAGDSVWLCQFRQMTSQKLLLIIATVLQPANIFPVCDNNPVCIIVSCCRTIYSSGNPWYWWKQTNWIKPSCNRMHLDLFLLW